jgi:hypothetical protein
MALRAAAWLARQLASAGVMGCPVEVLEVDAQGAAAAAGGLGV